MNIHREIVNQIEGMLKDRFLATRTNGTDCNTRHMP